MHDLPAILGGTPAVGFTESELEEAFAWPHLGEEELAAIGGIFQDRRISIHPVVGELEQAYCDMTGRKHAVAHCNGTTALMAAFWSLGLAPGDQVLVPSATFWASVLPMMWSGLVPVFCESEPQRLGLDPEDIRRRWNPKVKGMVIVPLWGIPSHYDELLAFAREKNLRVVEDASHAHGAVYQGRPCGSFGDVSVFSLQGDKLAPAGEGGVLLTDDATIRERVLCLGDIRRIVGLETPARRFAATSFGIKTRIAPVSAAIGLCQLRKLPRTNRIRRDNLVPLSHLLENYGFDSYLDAPGDMRTYFEHLVRWKGGTLSADGWLKALRAEGCQVELPRYPLVHQQPFFTEGRFREILRLPENEMPDYAHVSLPATTALNRDLLKLPSFPNEAPGVRAAYAHAIRKIGEAQEAIAAHLAAT